MRLRRLFCLLLCMVLILPHFCASPVRANSAQTIWSGVTSSGVIITDGDCPIQVEQEILTFRIPEFPQNYYYSVTDFTQYDASVTAEYTFYNPADYAVTATLVFPFGNLPDYGLVTDEATGEWAHESQAYADQYGVTVNGQSIDVTVRHTYALPYDDFSLDEDLGKLKNDYAADGFYTPDTTVTKYVFDVTLEDSKGFAAFSAGEHAARSKYFLNNLNSYSCEGSTRRYGTWVDNRNQIVLYVIGEPVNDLQWEIFQDGSQKTEAAGSVTLRESTSCTFLEFALTEYDPQSNISQIDWYNAFLESLNRSFPDHIPFDLTYELMRWYEYEITLQPGEKIINCVTAPIYPGINGQYEPAKYTYRYLLSPATTWDSFGALEIIVETPYYMLESNQQSFEKNHSGYRLSREGLPEGELEFILSSDQNPQKIVNTSAWLYLLFIFLPIGVLSLILIAGMAGIMLLAGKAIGKITKKKENT